MEVKHITPFESSLDAILDKDGAEARVAVFKATFDIVDDGSLRVAEKQDPVHVQDLYAGDPAASSVIHESNGAFYKPGTDCLVIGSVFSPTGRAVSRLDVSVEVGTLKHDVAVTGDRAWGYGALGLTMSPPQPFVEMPIRWERCFGGVDPFSGEEGHRRWEARNPIGTGFRVTKSREALDGLPLPNFESPRAMMRGWDDKPAPLGLGYIGRSWTPRRSFAGTFDDAWEKRRMPILPEDFDYRFFNGAPAELVAPRHLRGDEPVRLTHVTKRGVDTFRLPKMRVVFNGYARGQRFTTPGCLDTLEIKSVEQQIVLVWRLKYTVALNEAADVVKATVERFD